MTDLLRLHIRGKAGTPGVTDLARTSEGMSEIVLEKRQLLAHLSRGLRRSATSIT
eukprot:CAMPEP_0204228792 /NCGR_PEP_ID=MMETSP0361-20130328/86716_1 /ASSEMBLY_ACC=CAM_ASM_000343 /TAXON_ID=268821 /ORGANISM="Scrippsiella Hangoei, Strain SHTV-5" /LENGTH=54 /DNA_ID=CAMNT_0051196929 /DNA_START=35 /DNA_END=196 /DNA_ORIENTATION=+